MIILYLLQVQYTTLEILNSYLELLMEHAMSQVKYNHILACLLRKTKLLGCLCREDNYNGKVEVEEMICNQIDCSTRSFVDCREPVNPFGHCCPICGGIITLDFDSRFIFNDMKDFVDGEFTTSGSIRY